jgi:broad specificity phosphatase PhoE
MYAYATFPLRLKLPPHVLCGIKNNAWYTGIMKWPETLTIIRHGESEFNAQKKRNKDSAGFDRFKKLFEREIAVARDGNWPSERLRAMALDIWHGSEPQKSDYDTPLTAAGRAQAVATGRSLKELVELPDIIYVSPYRRTMETLEGMQKGWKGLAKAKVILEERIREQEHGLSTLFGNWRIYSVLEPLQGLLMRLEGEYAYRFLNGESKADVRDRVRSFTSTLVREHAGENVMLVTHHLTLLCLRANLERWGREQFMDVDLNEEPINCGVTTYAGNAQLGKDGRLVLETYNTKMY